VRFDSLRLDTISATIGKENGEAAEDAIAATEHEDHPPSPRLRRTSKEKDISSSLCVPCGEISQNRSFLRKLSHHEGQKITKF
jgi:hypothetical protein